MSNGRRRATADDNVITFDEPFVIDTSSPAPAATSPADFDVLGAYRDSLAPDDTPSIVDESPDAPGVHTTTTGGKVTVLEPFEIEGDTTPSTSDAIRESLADRPIETLSEQTARNDRTARIDREAPALARVMAQDQALADMRAHPPEGVEDEDIAGPVGAAARSAVRTLPFVGTFTDEAIGAARTLGDLARGRIEASDVPARYERNRDAERYIQDRADLEHPDASFLGTGLGIGGQAIGLGATPVGKAMSDFVGRGASVAGRLGRGTALAGALGAAEGLGSARTPLTSLETAKRTLGHAGMAAATNLPIQGGLEGLTWLANRLAPSNIQDLARNAAEKLATVQEGEATADAARRLLASGDEGTAARLTALEAERGMDTLAQEATGAHNRLLRASEEALGGTVHDQMKRAELARRFAETPASPEAVASSVDAMQRARSELEVFTGPEYPQGLRLQARNAIRQIDALEGQTSAFDLMDPEGMAHAYGLLDNAKRAIGRAYTSLPGATGRPGVTLPSSSPYKAFERAYGDVQANLENPEIWGAAATELQQRVNPAWSQYLPHAERFNAMAQEGVERSASNPFAQESEASGQAWSNIADRAGRWQQQTERDAIRRGAQSASNLATTLDDAYLGGRSSQATEQMRQAADDLDRIIGQMEVSGAARDEMRALANVQVRGVSVAQIVRGLAQAEAVQGASSPGLRELGIAMSGGRNVATKAAGAMQTLRDYMQSSNASAEGILRHLSSISRDPEIMQAVQATMERSGSDAQASVAPELQDSDFAGGAMADSGDELLQDEDFAN